jgi:hypothetical protein
MRRGGWSYLVAAGTVAGLAACGGGTPTSNPTPSPSPTPCTQSIVAQDSGGLPARSVAFNDFSVPDSGRLDVTMDWTLASSNVGFYLVPANTCTTIAEFNNRTCNFLVRSEPPGAKPRKISTPNFSAGNYRWLVANFADVQESLSLQIVLSKGSCAALVGTPPGAAEREPGALPALEDMIGR